MPRPRLRRKLCVAPGATYFKPRGIPLRLLSSENLTHEEVEALWLMDVKGVAQQQAARHMHTSQSTVQRILAAARHKVATAIIEGRAIRIDTKNKL